MKIDIGLILSESNVANIKKLEPELGDSYNFHYFIVKNNEEIIEEYKKHYYEVDAFVFSGPVLYEVLEKELDIIDKPSYIIEDDLANIYKQLFKILIRNPGLEFSRVYIDFIDDRLEAEFGDVFLEGSIPYQMRWDTEDPYLREENILKRHISLWEQDKIDLSITKFGMLVDKFKDQGVKYKFIPPSSTYLKNFLIEAIEEIKTDKLVRNKMVTAYIELSKKDLFNMSEHEKELACLQLRGETIKYLKRFDFTINSNNNQIEIMMTIEELLDLTNDLESSGLEFHLEEELKKNIFIGYGSGRTVSQAKVNALEALDYANNNEKSTSVFVSENKRIYKNFGKEEEKTIINEPNYRIMDLSEKLDINTSHLQNIVDYCSKMGTNKVFAGEIATELGVTDRTASRVLNRILENVGASVTNEKRNTGKGRPVKYYLLNFIDNNGDLIY